MTEGWIWGCFTMGREPFAKLSLNCR